MDELTCLLMLIAQGYNRIATIYPIPKYMTGKYRKEYDCYKVQIDYEAIRLVVVNLPFEIKLYNIMSSKYIDKNDLI